MLALSSSMSMIILASWFWHFHFHGRSFVLVSIACPKFSLRWICGEILVDETDNFCCIISNTNQNVEQRLPNYGVLSLTDLDINISLFNDNIAKAWVFFFPFLRIPIVYLRWYNWDDGWTGKLEARAFSFLADFSNVIEQRSEVLCKVIDVFGSNSAKIRLVSCDSLLSKVYGPPISISHLGNFIWTILYISCR